MKGLSPPVSRLLAVSLLVLLVFGLYSGVARPLQQRFQDYDESIDQSLQLLERYQRETLDPESLAQRQRRLERATQGTGGLLKGDNEAIAGAFVQHFVTTAVEGEGGSLRSIQVLPVKLENGFRRVATRAQMTLTTPALRDLLYRIEASKPFLFIDNLDVRLGRKSRRRRDTEQDEEIQLLVRMDVFGFLAAPPPQTAGQAS